MKFDDGLIRNQFKSISTLAIAENHHAYFVNDQFNIILPPRQEQQWSRKISKWVETDNSMLIISRI